MSLSSFDPFQPGDSADSPSPAFSMRRLRMRFFLFFPHAKAPHFFVFSFSPGETFS